MEYTNDIICSVEYINKEEKTKKGFWKKIKQNKIISITAFVFTVLVLIDMVLLSSFVKIISTIQ